MSWVWSNINFSLWHHKNILGSEETWYVLRNLTEHPVLPVKAWEHLRWVTHLHARMGASTRCCSEAQRGWHQSLCYETHRAHRFHHNLPTLDPVVARPLVRRCCQIFRLPRTTSIRHIYPRLPCEECVESEMTQLEESSFIWRERRDTVLLSTCCCGKREAERVMIGVCLLIVDMLLSVTWTRYLDGGESQVTHMRESLLYTSECWIRWLRFRIFACLLTKDFRET